MIHPCDGRMDDSAYVAHFMNAAHTRYITQRKRWLPVLNWHRKMRKSTTL